MINDNRRDGRALPALLALAIALVIAIAPPAAHAGRLKDLASVQGVRSNQLLGYGLVVGLVGTGDGASAAPFTAQSLRNMLAQYGVTIPPSVTIRPKNVAAVSAGHLSGEKMNLNAVFSCHP